MVYSKIAIICKGNEILYGNNFFHLFQFRDDKEKYASSKFKNTSIEMYSIDVFYHTNVSKETICIYVGLAQNPNGSYKNIFHKYGMDIYQKDNNFILKANYKELDDYDSFIIYANNKKNEYFKLEKKYINYLPMAETKWIMNKFEPIESRKIFNNKIKVKQLYDCLGFVMYLDILKN